MCGKRRRSATSRAQSPAPSISVTVRMTSLTVIRGRFSPGRGDPSTLRLPPQCRTLGARAHLSPPRGLSMGSAAHVRDLALPHLRRDTRAADGQASYGLVAAAHLPLPFRRLPRTERAGPSIAAVTPRPSLSARLARVTWSRVAFMVALLALGLVLTRVLGRTTPKRQQGDAVAVARPNVDFKPQGYNIRLVRQGIPPRPVWAVSFWIRKSRRRLLADHPRARGREQRPSHAGAPHDLSSASVRSAHPAEGKAVRALRCAPGRPFLRSPVLVRVSRRIVERGRSPSSRR